MSLIQNDRIKPLNNEDNSRLNVSWIYNCSMNRCICDNRSLTVDCIYNPVTNPSGQFIDLSFGQTSMETRFLFIDEFPEIPSRGFQNARFVENGQIIVAIRSASSIRENAFETLGNLDTATATAYTLDFDILTLKAPQLANYAFNNVRVKRLTFDLISSNSVSSNGYQFNLDSLAGAVSIDTLEFIRCDQVGVTF